MLVPSCHTASCLLLFACLVLPLCSAHTPIRGVHPRDVSKYAVGDASNFACGDGSSVLWEQVNDDHCDCATGADEPGTSGKPRALFYSTMLQLRSCSTIFFVSTDVVINLSGNRFLARFALLSSNLPAYWPPLTRSIFVQPAATGCSSATTGASKDRFCILPQ